MYAKRSIAKNSIERYHLAYQSLLQLLTVLLLLGGTALAKTQTVGSLQPMIPMHVQVQTKPQAAISQTPNLAVGDTKRLLFSGQHLAQALTNPKETDTFTPKQATQLTSDPELTFGATKKRTSKKDKAKATTMSQVHMIDDVLYKTKDGVYQMVTEIPAGTNEKWQTDPIKGDFYHDKEDGKPRVINFLPYPFNYGIVPQTILDKAKGGDGDPLDIITLAPATPRGDISKVRVIGALKLKERGEIDTKVIALLPNGPFQDVNDLDELLVKYPMALDIVKSWFESYKGLGKFTFEGYADKKEAEAMIEDHHQQWLDDLKQKAAQGKKP